MPETAPNPELLRSLGKLVRGLSALFWGLPVAFIVCVVTARTDSLQNFGTLPAAVTTGWLLFGLWQLGHFQQQERVWINGLDRAKQLALLNLGLSPFLYWWNQWPAQSFYTAMVAVMAVAGMLFLADLNLVLRRLSAMLPDESLRQETRSFTTLNRLLLLGIMLLGIAILVLMRFPGWLPGPGGFLQSLLDIGGLWLLVFLVLPPLAMTMALIWKIKEVVLESIFGADR